MGGLEDVGGKKGGDVISSAMVIIGKRRTPPNFLSFCLAFKALFVCGGYGSLKERAP
jgi:hypothetical protein